MSTRVPTSRRAVAALVGAFHDVDWLDLLREESLARLLEEAARLLAHLPEPVEVRSEMRLIVARRAR